MSDSYKVALESGGNPTAKNPNSTAFGSRQFLASTFLRYVKQNPPAWAQGMTDDEILAQRANPDREKDVADLYDADSRKTLEKIGVAESPQAMYAMWHFGNAAGGAGAKFLQASGDTSTSSLFPAAVLRANPYLAGKTKDQVLANWEKRTMGAGGTADAAPAAAPKALDDPEAFIDFFAPPKATQIAEPEAGLFLAPTTAAAAPGLDTAGLQASEAAVNKAQSIKDNTGFGDALHAAYLNQMTPYFSFLMRSSSGEDYSTVDPQWQNDVLLNPKKYLGGYNDDERETLLGATNAADYSSKVARIMEERGNMQTLSNAGTGMATTAGIMAGFADPMNLLAGLGTAKIAASVGMSSFQLAKAGRYGVAAAANMAENAVGNMAIEAAQQALGTHKDPSDYLMAATQGALFGAVLSPLIIRSGHMALARETQQRVVQQQMADLAEAAAQLGPDATIAQVQARASEISAARTAQLRADAKARPVSGDRVDAPDATELAAMEEPPLTAGEAAQQHAGVPSGTTPNAGLSDDLKGPFPYGTSQGVYSPWEMDKYLQMRADMLATKPEWQEHIVKMTDGEFRHDTVKDLPAGVHSSSEVSSDARYAPLVKAAEAIVDQFLPGKRVILGTRPQTVGALGEVLSTRDAHYIAIAARTPDGMMHTLMHELGHAIVHEHLSKVDPRIIRAVNAEWGDFLKSMKTGDMDVAIQKRLGVTSQMRNIKDMSLDEYNLNRDEYLAEQFTKYIYAKAEANGVKLPEGVAQQMIAAVKAALDYVKDVVRRGFVKPGKASEELFDAIMKSAVKDADETAGFLDASLTIPEATSKAAAPVGTPSAFDVAHGLDVLPTDTPLARAELKIMRKLIQDAEAWDKANPVDPERVRTIMSKVGMATPGTILAMSSNPLARMLSGTLVEHSMGGNGRRSTVSIRTVMREREFLGNSLVDYGNFYTMWRDRDGKLQGVADDMLKMQKRQEFDKLVAMEREARWHGGSHSTDQAVLRAADALDDVYTKLRDAQVSAKTPGWARLPDSSRGYAPRIMNKGMFLSMTVEQERGLLDVLSNQLQQLEGFDKDFSDQFARKYLDHARTNANGGHEIPANIVDPSAAEYVRQAMVGMGLTAEQIQAYAGRLAAGAPSHTKARLELDLNADVPLANGTTMKLMDLFDTDQVQLLRRQARKVAGEVSLVEQGIMGRQGLRVIRKALELDPASRGADQAEVMKAFDQAAAEITGTPFGDQLPETMESLMTLVASSRLGGMGFTQLLEQMNVGIGLGVIEAARTTGMIPRMIREIRASVRGGRVDNPILSGVEVPGAEFGTAGYKMQMMLDSPSQVFDTYNHKSASSASRLIRAAGHSMRIVSMHRAIEGAQRRAVAERLTVLMAKAIAGGRTNKVLADIGLTDSLLSRLAPDIGQAATYNGGRLAAFDVTKFADAAAGSEFVAAVHRGVGQLIQEAMPGEVLGVQHSSIGKVLTQFRTYPLVAMEKQWGRQRAMHGAAGVLARATAVAPLALLVHGARVQLAALGRPDAEEYIQKQFTPLALGRATTSYMSVLGLFPDIVDGLSAVAPDAWVEALGDDRRGGKGLGSAIPAIGYLNDGGKVLADKDPAAAMRLMPMSNIPHLMFLSNMMRSE